MLGPPLVDISHQIMANFSLDELGAPIKYSGDDESDDGPAPAERHPHEITRLRRTIRTVGRRTPAISEGIGKRYGQCHVHQPRRPCVPAAHIPRPR